MNMPKTEGTDKFPSTSLSCLTHIHKGTTKGCLKVVLWHNYKKIH